MDSVRIISFSLFGKKPIYITGAIENSRLCNEIYPGWIARFYVSDEVPTVVIETLRANGAEVIIKKNECGYGGTFWRFYPASEEKLDAMVVRDVDSRLSKRESLLVEEWLRSGKALHIIRDHPNHVAPIMGGMWGCRGGVIDNIQHQINAWRMMHKNDRCGNYEVKNSDQIFLFEMLYKRLRNEALIHSEFIRFVGEGAKRITYPREGLGFIGQIFNEYGETRKDHLEALKLGIKLGRENFPVRNYSS